MCIDDDEEIGWRDAWCPWCGETLPAERHGLRKFCCRECNIAYNNGKRPSAVRVNLRCQVCERNLSSTGRRRDARYCSNACQNRAYRHRLRCKAVG